MKKRMLSLLLTAVMLFAAVSMAGLRGAAAATVISNIKLTYSASGVRTAQSREYEDDGDWRGQHDRIPGVQVRF